MHKLILVCSLFLAACAFNPSGAPLGAEVDGSVGDDGDGGVDTDGDAGSAPDASSDAMICSTEQIATPDGCQARPHIECLPVVTDGSGTRRRPLELRGWISYGLLDNAPGGAVTPVAIMYGSNFDSYSVNVNCPDKWAVPYPSSCNGKAQVAWMGEGTNAVTTLTLHEDVHELNLAVLYSNGAVRWGDLKLGDGDPTGFTVSGGFCQIQPQGDGGLIITRP